MVFVYSIRAYIHTKLTYVQRVHTAQSIFMDLIRFSELLRYVTLGKADELILMKNVLLFIKYVELNFPMNKFYQK